VSFPQHYAFTTQPHQDFWYIRGTPETFTAWMPVGDCPRELGGLALLERSHKLGFLPHEKAIGAGGNGVRTDKLGLRWLASDFNAGDVVIFHSYMIHGALDNHTPDRLRLSLDYRYQRANEAVDPSSLKPHYG
jgi:ectoine hydroxylase-related dioxygenase (phytanoyl-CoA dioxygenase family)